VATVNDPYGGKKPDVLSKSNETICEPITEDAEIMAEVKRLVREGRGGQFGRQHFLGCRTGSIERRGKESRLSPTLLATLSSNYGCRMEAKPRRGP
jgi:hypothetical protein